jgi:hypothetical protein
VDPSPTDPAPASSAPADFDPEAPGRGPRLIGQTYLVAVLTPRPHRFIAKYRGVTAGVTKGADTLAFERAEGMRLVAYRDLEWAIRVVPHKGECGGFMIRPEGPGTPWKCLRCGHVDESG